ncbi:MAG: hypothetical protein QM757_45050 [Paludibaculum sp.]
MATPEAILELVNHAFASSARPEHFTNYRHCEECQEHDALLRARNVDNLAVEDVGNAGWDPICFISPEGFTYYLPALARLALADKIGPQGWYGPLFLFHLSSKGGEAAYVRHLTREQQQAVAAVLSCILEAHWDRVVDHSCENQLQSAIDIWSALEPRHGI